MKNRYSWRDLIGEPPLCEGGRLASIVFCCDPRKKPCPILDEALSMLGIAKEYFIRVMEENMIPVPEKDGTCFGNMAFCPSPEKPSMDRDEALLKMKLSLSDFLKYKFMILKKLLISDEKMEYAFSTRLLRQFAVEALDLETKKVCKALALGNMKRGLLLITEVFKEKDLEDPQVEEVLTQTEYVGVRIPRGMVDKLDELVAEGTIESRSDGIRRALLLYLSALRKPTEKATEKVG